MRTIRRGLTLFKVNSDHKPFPPHWHVGHGGSRYSCAPCCLVLRSALAAPPAADSAAEESSSESWRTRLEARPPPPHLQQRSWLRANTGEARVWSEDVGWVGLGRVVVESALSLVLLPCWLGPVAAWKKQKRDKRMENLELKLGSWAEWEPWLESYTSGGFELEPWAADWENSESAPSGWVACPRTLWHQNCRWTGFGQEASWGSLQAAAVASRLALHPAGLPS